MLDPEFASIKVLEKFSHGRGDDIESLGYSILLMIKPEIFPIPWSSVNLLDQEEVLRLKCEFLGIQYPPLKD
jgi:hypothetical protein